MDHGDDQAAGSRPSDLPRRMPDVRTSLFDLWCVFDDARQLESASIAERRQDQTLPDVQGQTIPDCV